MAKRNLPKDTMYFRYVNQNPKGKHIGDCVVRALASATDNDWDSVYDELYLIGKKYKVMPNSDKSYEKYLKDRGFNKCKQPRHDDNTKYTGKEFCEKLDTLYKRGLITKNPVVISIGSHHLSTIVYDSVSGFTINDIWDCSDKCVGKYWMV